MTHDSTTQGFGTLAIHAGQPADPITGAVIPPISLSTTFQQVTPGEHKGYDYSRSGNPTRCALEQNIAALEGGNYGFAFSSGLAATATLVTTLKAGDEVISADDVYGGTRRYFTRVSHPNSGIVYHFVDFNKEGALEAVLNDRTKLVWIESPTNPTLKIFNIKEVARKVHEKNPNIIVAVDNTFMTPYFQKPLDLGADVVVHSATKYLNGHSDVVMGIIVCKSQELKDRIGFVQNGMGAVPSPFDCFLVLRSLKTLHVRMREHAENAIKVARFLEAHSKVTKVIYPGLESHPQHAIAKEQYNKGFGGMITFFLKGGLEESRRFLESLKLVALAESLGGVESLIEHPAIMTHASVPADVRAGLGIDDSLIRMSVGIENLDDIIADLERGFNAV
jgi:cystathionine gamma-lyase